MEFDAKQEVNSTALAAVLGVTGRRIQQLTQDGIITAKSKGKFVLSEAVQNYIDFRAKEKAISKAESDKLNADVSIKQGKAIMTVLEAKELQGKMHRAEDIEAVFTEHIFAVRGALLALPGRLAVDVFNATNSAEASIIIQNEVYKILSELANYKYDPAIFGKKVRDRKKWVDIDDEIE